MILKVGLGNEILFGGRTDVVIGVLLEEGHAVVDLYLIRVGQGLGVPGIANELFILAGLH
jgi:hypothetical protein